MEQTQQYIHPRF